MHLPRVILRSTDRRAPHRARILLLVLASLGLAWAQVRPTWVTLEASAYVEAFAVPAGLTAYDTGVFVACDPDGPDALRVFVWLGAVPRASQVGDVELLWRLDGGPVRRASWLRDPSDATVVAPRSRAQTVSVLADLRAQGTLALRAFVVPGAPDAEQPTYQYDAGGFADVEAALDCPGRVAPDPFADAPLLDPFADAPDEDPFADAPDEDPFADAPVEDPFADALDADPFADAVDVDPFADAVDVDPFADAPATDPRAVPGAVLEVVELDPPLADRLVPGAVVHLPTGIVELDRFVLVSGALTLIGAGPGASVVRYVAADRTDDTNMIAVQAGALVLKGLTLDANGREVNALAVIDGTFDLEDVALRGAMRRADTGDREGFGGYGFAVLNGTGTLRRVTSVEHGLDGFLFTGASSAQAFDLVAAKNGRSGLTAEQAVERLTVSGGRFEGNTEMGLTSFSTGTVRIDGAVLTGNGFSGLQVSLGAPLLTRITSFENVQAGVAYFAGGGGSLLDSELRDNGSHGVFVGADASPTLERNRFVGNGGFGVFSSEGRPVVGRGNDFSDNVRGDVSVPAESPTAVPERPTVPPAPPPAAPVVPPAGSATTAPPADPPPAGTWSYDGVVTIVRGAEAQFGYVCVVEWLGPVVRANPGAAWIGRVRWLELDGGGEDPIRFDVARLDTDLLAILDDWFVYDLLDDFGRAAAEGVAAPSYDLTAVLDDGSRLGLLRIALTAALVSDIDLDDEDCFWSGW